MRYYFHLRIGENCSPDEIGLDLPDLETAYLEAFQAAQEMWSECLAECSDPLLRTFEISDERGRVLLTLPFREVLERARKPTAGLPKLRQSLQAELKRRRKLTASLQEEVKTAREKLEATRKLMQTTSDLCDRTAVSKPRTVSNRR